MLKQIYRLIDVINGKLTGRYPELVRRLREEIVDISEAEETSPEFYFARGTLSFKGIKCGEPSTVSYKRRKSTSKWVTDEWLSAPNRRRAILRDLTERIHRNPHLAVMDCYVIMRDKEITSRVNEATYQGIVFPPQAYVSFAEGEKDLEIARKYMEGRHA